MRLIPFSPEDLGAPNAFDRGVYHFQKCRHRLGAFHPGEVMLSETSQVKELAKGVFLATNCVSSEGLEVASLPAPVVTELVKSKGFFTGRSICESLRPALAKHISEIKEMPPLTPATSAFLSAAPRAVPIERPLAVIVLGGLGVGKSTCIRWIQEKLQNPLHVADADFFRDPPSEEDMRVDTQPDFDLAAHESCLQKRDALITRCIEENVSLFIPTTGRHLKSTRDLIQSLERRGFSVRVLHISAPIEQVQDRIQQREEAEGRGVYGHPSQVSSSARQSLKNAERLVEEGTVDNVAYITNDEQVNEQLTEVATNIDTYIQQQKNFFPSRPPSACQMEAHAAPIFFSTYVKQKC